MFTLKAIKKNNGATIDYTGSAMQYAKGYQVSKKDLYIISAYKLRKAQLLELVHGLATGECLGIWIDGGKAYIDISEHIATKREAMKLGKARNQLSIWNWKASEAIAC